MIILSLFFACQDSPSTFQVIDIQDDTYEIVQRSIDSLHSPRTMEGDLGNLYVGGSFNMDFNTTMLSYAEGRPLNVHYVVQDDVAYPVDRDGLIAFSFYHHLEDTVGFINTSSQDLDGLLPMNTAISPIISDLTLAFLPMENAAYVPTLHHFLLLTDAIPKEVPLAANKGVVAHEFGHALFHFLTTGGTTTPRLLTTDAKGQDSLYSLDEGLADVLGYLVTNRPNFIADSLKDQDRALDTEHLASNVSPLPGDNTDEGLLSLYNPYPLGSVFAATIWDVDVQLNNKSRLLNWIIDTTTEFGRQVSMEERQDSVDLGMQWLDVWIDQAQTVEEATLACEAIKERWDLVYEVTSCS